MKKNIFDLSNLELNSEDEHFESLFDNDIVKIERIVSTGQITTMNTWLNEPKNEWVIVLQGNAAVTFDDNSTFELKVGDQLYIPANQNHRVSFTSENPPCIWLAVHINS
jgi:cupin 2 domain-containing protein